MPPRKAVTANRNEHIARKGIRWQERIWCVVICQCVNVELAIIDEIKKAKSGDEPWGCYDEVVLAPRRPADAWLRGAGLV
jgi:hypothetical protein